ncbi:uncharacterized protein BX664DRAFT_320386 [Halteromyces radiatus]|uniref:uncharacterized protein n=1 Tax=Halteromyces radiatus TaxID=101107 RepID=UPI00221E9B5B|nr:uncharacterized protein BX664DRAFT_320386 [Halteromyces radiatus]KAI8099100.1 hypothetical protein BX664DRAFT_320386 [Halteromyces radiatus]
MGRKLIFISLFFFFFIYFILFYSFSVTSSSIGYFKMKSNKRYDHEAMMDYNKEINHQQQNTSCCHSICCICLPCCPIGIRCLCCIGLLAIVAAMIVLGSLIALFKIPTVDYNGLVENEESRFKVDDALAAMAFEINLGFKLGIVNPNIESAHFDSLKATAFYPTAPHQPVGGGSINDLTINPYSVTNITFPFQIMYNPNNATAGMLQDIVDKCGLSGFPAKDIDVYYDLTPTVRLFGIFPLSITIRRQVSFPCPIESGLFHS